MEGTTSRLSSYDIIVGIDRSGSMGDPGKTGRSKWEEAQEGTKAFVREAIKVDSDGVTICLFNGADNLKEYKNVKDAAVVDQIFTENQPASGTPTHVLINKYTNEYISARKAGNSPKPIILGVVTDGAPSDPKATKLAIINATKEMEKDAEIGISFIQIGADAGAAAFLTDLDDNLQNEGAKFDIVDTKHMDNIDNIITALESALDD